MVAYAQLIPHHNQIYQVCQMVVKPSYQRQNLGRTILLALIGIAKGEGVMQLDGRDFLPKRLGRKAIAITLNARLTAVGFYQKLGFQTSGKPFPSDITGVSHIAMNRRL